MATIENKTLKDIPHNTGPVRVSKWKKKTVISMKSSKEQKRTPARLESSLKFSLLRQFFSPVRAFIAIGFANSPGRATDRALKVNYHIAFRGSYPDIELDFSAMQLSEGPLPLPEKISVSPSTTNSVYLSWSQSDSDDGEDLLMVLLFNPSNRNAIVYTEAARRSDLEVSLPYDTHWDNTDCLVFAAFHKADSTLSSPSAFLGKIHLSHSQRVDFDSSKLFTPRKNKPYNKKDPKDFSVTGISGSVGPLVFFTKNKDDVFVRIKPKERQKPQSQAELQAVMRFKLVSKFLYKLHPFVKIGFAAHSEYTLPHAAAMKANLKTIVSGIYPDYKIDYSKAQLSDGPLSPPSVSDIRLDFPTLTISWEYKKSPELSSISVPSNQPSDQPSDSPSINQPADSPDDRLLLAILNPEVDEHLITLTDFTRKDTSATLQLPLSWSTTKLLLFLSFTSQNPIPLSSPTTFLPISQ